MTTSDNKSELQSVLDHLESATTSQQSVEPPVGLHSPTVAGLPREQRPNPLPVCAACPSSMWFASKGGGLKAFCRVMHSITWTNEEPDAITSCDGITLPIE